MTYLSDTSSLIVNSDILVSSEQNKTAKDILTLAATEMWCDEVLDGFFDDKISKTSALGIIKKYAIRNHLDKAGNALLGALCLDIITFSNEGS